MASECLADRFAGDHSELSTDEAIFLGEFCQMFDSDMIAIAPWLAVAVQGGKIF